MSEKAPERIRATSRPCRDGWWTNISYADPTCEFSAIYISEAKHRADLERLREACAGHIERRITGNGEHHEEDVECSIIAYELRAIDIDALLEGKEKCES